jgi:hypothetical protein
MKRAFCAKPVRVGRRVETLWNLAAAAVEVGVTTHLLKYWSKQGVLPGPSRLHGRRHYYTRQDLKKIKKVFARHQCQRMTKKGIANMVGVSPCVIDWHIKTGSIPAPTFELGSKKFYTVCQAERIKDYFLARREAKEDLVLLMVGLRQLGTTKDEYQWLLRCGKELVPTPTLVLGKSRRNKWFTIGQCKDLLKQIRKLRG